MADCTEAEITERLAKATAEPVRVSAGQHYVWRDEDGSLRTLDLTGIMPARRTGNVTVHDVKSFAAYCDKHSDENSEIYADLDAAVITAVLDAHKAAQGGRPEDEESTARWQQHRVVLKLETTQAWDAWLEFDRQMRPQVAFAEFLEDNFRDLAPEGTVKAADLLEVAQSFTASTKTQFVSGQRLRSGDLEIVLDEQTTASAGKQRKIEIPEEFQLAIAPYEDCGRALISARFRYRAKDGSLTLGYFLNQPERVREDAVREIAEQVADATERDVWLGVAP